MEKVNKFPLEINKCKKRGKEHQQMVVVDVTENESKCSKLFTESKSLKVGDIFSSILKTH